MAKKKQVFACLKGEHVKIPDCPVDQPTIGTIKYDAGVCKFCYCVFYAPLGEVGKILLLKGNA